MKKLLILGGLYLALSPAFAQNRRAYLNDSLRRAYDQETIFVFANGSRYAKGQQVFASGLNQRNLESEFLASPIGLTEFRGYRKMRTVSTILTVASLATTIVGLTRVRSDNSYWVWWGAGVAIGLGNGVVTSRANNRLQQAVWIRNRDVLTNTR